jgi:hypothetical protein
MKWIAIVIILIVVVIMIINSPNQCTACNYDMGFGTTDCEKCGYKTGI